MNKVLSIILFGLSVIVADESRSAVNLSGISVDTISKQAAPVGMVVK